MANAEAGTRNFSARTTGYIVNDDGTILTPKRAVISASSSGAADDSRAARWALAAAT